MIVLGVYIIIVTRSIEIDLDHITSNYKMFHAFMRSAAKSLSIIINNSTMRSITKQWRSIQNQIKGLVDVPRLAAPYWR